MRLRQRRDHRLEPRRRRQHLEAGLGLPIEAPRDTCRRRRALGGEEGPRPFGSVGTAGVCADLPRSRRTHRGRELVRVGFRHEDHHLGGRPAPERPEALRPRQAEVGRECVGGASRSHVEGRVHGGERGADACEAVGASRRAPARDEAPHLAEQKRVVRDDEVHRGVGQQGQHSFVHFVDDADLLDASRRITDLEADRVPPGRLGRRDGFVEAPQDIAYRLGHASLDATGVGG